MKLISVLCFVFLIGCSSTNSKLDVNEVNASSTKTMSPQKRQMLGNISKWANYARANIERYMGDTSPFLGESIKIEFEINNDGMVKTLKVLESSGNNKLKDVVLNAVDQASPFNTKILSAEEFEQIRIIKVSFNFNS